MYCSKILSKSPILSKILHNSLFRNVYVLPASNHHIGLSRKFFCFKLLDFLKQDKTKKTYSKCSIVPIFGQYNYKNSDGSQYSSHSTLWRWDLITTVLIFFGVIEDPLLKDSPLIITIKRGILAKQRKQYLEADLILHSALKMAQDLSYTDAETYIFDVMADNFFEKGDYTKAKDLYHTVISRLAEKEDFKLDSEELVEISLKLAFCYGKLNKFEVAQQGFQFAIDTQLSRTDKFWNNKLLKLIETNQENNELDDTQRNSLALLGMAYDMYSKYLADRSSQLIEKALVYRMKALKISTIVNGDKHEQTLVLENDVADLYARMDNFEKAKCHLRRAISGAKEIESSELPMYYLNMASVHCQEGRMDMSKTVCQKSYNYLVKSKLENLPEKDRKQLLKKTEMCMEGVKFY